MWDINCFISAYIINEKCDSFVKIIPKWKNILSKADGIYLKDNIELHEYPLCHEAVNTDLVYVGRIRPDLDNKKALTFWCVADNLRKGASSNAIQIMNLISGM